MGSALRGIAYGLGSLTAVWLWAFDDWIYAAIVGALAAVGICLEVSLERRRTN